MIDACPVDRRIDSVALDVPVEARDEDAAVRAAVAQGDARAERAGRTLKEFRAVCPVSRFMVARVYTRATAGRTLRAEARDAS